MEANEKEVYRRAVKQAAADFIRVLDQLAAVSTRSRGLSLAKTHVETGKLWALEHLEAANA